MDDLRRYYPKNPPPELRSPSEERLDAGRSRDYFLDQMGWSSQFGSPPASLFEGRSWVGTGADCDSSIAWSDSASTVCNVASGYESDPGNHSQVSSTKKDIQPTTCSRRSSGC